jgi:hypothetical protein
MDLRTLKLIKKMLLDLMYFYFLGLSFLSQLTIHFIVRFQFDRSLNGDGTSDYYSFILVV